MPKETLDGRLGADDHQPVAIADQFDLITHGLPLYGSSANRIRPHDT